MKNIEKYLGLLNDEVNGLLLTSRYSRMYGAEFDIAEGIAIVSKNGCRYYTDSRYIESAQNGIQGFQVLEVDRENSYVKQINAAIEEFGITALGYEERYLTVEEWQSFESKLNAKLVPFNKPIYDLRAVKEPWELDIMRKAQDITDKAFSEVLGKIKVGMTERQLQAELIYCLYKNGADNLSFDPIVVSGPNTSMPHGVAGDRKIQDGDFITMDFGALYCGYCADMTRTVAASYVTDEMEKVYNIVLKAQLAGIAATKAGVCGKDIDGAARQVITEEGYGRFFGHGYGHGLGMEVHEAPSCSVAGDSPLPAGVICSAEPGIYLPGKFGVRIEDVVILTEDGCEDITHSPKNLIVV